MEQLGLAKTLPVMLNKIILELSMNLSVLDRAMILAWPSALSRMMSMRSNYDNLLWLRISSLKIMPKTVSKSSPFSSSSDDGESSNTISLNLFIYNPNGQLQSKQLGLKRNERKNPPRQFVKHLRCGGDASANRRRLG